MLTDLQPHEQRMLDERAELAKKMKALVTFFGSDRFNALGADDQSLMRMQYAAMMQYHVILHMRILKFWPFEVTDEPK